MELIETCKACLEGDIMIAQGANREFTRWVDYEVRYPCKACERLGKKVTITEIKREKPQLKLIRGGK